MSNYLLIDHADYVALSCTGSFENNKASLTLNFMRI